MILFKKEKDLVLKLINLVLLLWLVASIILTYTTLMSIIMPRPVKTYNEYKITDCYYYEDVKTIDDSCLTSYNQLYKYNNDESYNNKKNLFILIGSDVIVGVALYLLNKDGKKGAK